MCDVKEQNDKPERNGYRKKYRKILFLAAVIAAGLFLYNYKKAHTVPEEIYVEDYPEIYAEELRIIFGEDCEIGEKNTTFREGDVCGCGYVTPTLQYDTWEVTYHDRRGETFTQTIDNRESLESLQYSWLQKHLKQYYEQKYLIDYFDEGTFEELTKRTYCYVSIGVGESGYTTDIKEEYDRIGEGNRKYKEQLWETYKNRDTMLCLSELNCEEIYNHYPITTSLHLSIDDRELSGEEKAVREKAVQDKVLEMIQSILRETDDTCNLKVQVVSANGQEDLYDGASCW